MIDVLGIDEFPENTFGRIIERRDYIMFEDARDAVMFKLGLK